MKQRIQKLIREFFDSELMNTLEVTVFVENTEFERMITHQISNLVSLADAKYLGLNEQASSDEFSIFARFSKDADKQKFLTSLNKLMNNKHSEVKFRVVQYQL